jgi:hypothetical protein
MLSTLSANTAGRPVDISSMLDIPPLQRSRIITYRKERRESQCRFWTRFGVTQSRGSRIESDAQISAPVSLLLALYFNGAVTDAQLKRASTRPGIALRGNGLPH